MEIGWNQWSWKFCAKFNYSRPHFQNACRCQLETSLNWVIEQMCPGFGGKDHFFLFLLPCSCRVKPLSCPVLLTFPAAATSYAGKCLELSPRDLGFVTSYGSVVECFLFFLDWFQELLFCDHLAPIGFPRWRLFHWIRPSCNYCHFSLFPRFFCVFLPLNKHGGSLRLPQGPCTPHCPPFPTSCNSDLQNLGSVQGLGRDLGDRSRTGQDFVY